MSLQSFDPSDLVAMTREYYQSCEQRIHSRFGSVGMLLARILVVAFVLIGMTWWKWGDVKELPGINTLVEHFS